MKKYYWYIIPSLLICLFIYAFYRTDKTVINLVIIQLFGLQGYQNLKLSIIQVMPLNKYVIYSLPEGLWIFCITLTSKEFYIEIFKKRINCAFIPIVFAIGLEFLQLLHVTNGYFDFFDIGISLFFWFLASYIIRAKQTSRNIFTGLNYNNIFCISSYCIVYFAHVIH